MKLLLFRLWVSTSVAKVFTRAVVLYMSFYGEVRTMLL